MKRVTVPAMGEATVEWTVIAESLPEGGMASITGRTLATDAPSDKGPESSDALKVGVRIVPDGIAQRIAAGGVVANEKTVTLDLPSDRIEPATTIRLTVSAGVHQSAESMANLVIDFGRFGSPGAADQLMVAPILGNGAGSKEVRESLALLSRYARHDGWGWWEDDSVDAGVTAQVLVALARASEAGLPVYPTLMSRGMEGAVQQYNGTNLWEHRAILASAMVISAWDGSDDAVRKQLKVRIDEVQRRGEQMSPYARLMLAEALAKMGDATQAAKLVNGVLKDAVAGPDSAYVPAGEHIGWSASTIETTAQALIVLDRLGRDSETQARLARWLADPERCEWRSQDETALAAVALADYTRAHPDPTAMGKVEVTLNGARIDFSGEPAKTVVLSVPQSLLRTGANTFTIKRDGDGEAFFSVEARVFRPALAEQDDGIRVIRRFEARNSAGLWEVVKGPVKASEPVRCTVLIWPDGRQDSLRVTEPIPAGFEFVESDHSGYWTREEIRDGAVIHSMRSSGEPFYFRYYLRAESGGGVSALPAYAESLRRPSVRGSSAPFAFDIVK